ncbi:hypothetical protein B296_00004675 [Ensete ventricosum]|uniref:Mitochondrial inner membrane protease subunit 2 n=1 Tax=Ensete ventricosum TaxID=4639 RepID=A0A427AUK8_ENSVE|nr:hypothetical protein B296_00004675 [Ensete ventricosum]
MHTSIHINFGHSCFGFFYRSPTDHKKTFVKRLIALPGDWVQVPESSEILKIPEGHCWVEGDNAACSLDSRSFGFSDRQLLGAFIEGLKPKIKGEVKVRQPRTVKAVIAFARIQEKRLNQDAQRMRTTPRLTAYEPPSASRYPLLPKILTSSSGFDSREGDSCDLATPTNKPSGKKEGYRENFTTLIYFVTDYLPFQVRFIQLLNLLSALCI